MNLKDMYTLCVFKLSGDIDQEIGLSCHFDSLKFNNVLAMNGVYLCYRVGNKYIRDIF